LIGGRKLAGILLETAGPPLRLAVGIGVNLRSTPPAEALAARALAPVDLATATGQVVAPEVLLVHLAPAFADWEARLVREGFAPLRAAWLERAAHLGERVAVRLPGGTLREGRFETIDATGALVLATEGRDGDDPGRRCAFRGGGGGGCCSRLTSGTPTRSSRSTTAWTW
jgi:BirA family transcriptional regulator, biotin operon repressor / biotin---[acetyl-CoA-carboxylase] ligase